MDTLSNIVDWAKYGTSYHTFPWVSVASNICNILVSDIVAMLNFVGVEKGNVVDLISAEIALTDFFKR